MLYRDGSYPFHSLGDITFLWRPLSSATSESVDCRMQTRQLWMWTHPACHSDILTELKKVFNLTEADCRSLPVHGVCDSRDTEETTTSATKKRKKTKNIASCRKRPRLADDNKVDVSAAAKDAVEGCDVSSHSPVTQRKMSSELSDESKSLLLVTSVHDISIQSESAGIKDIESVKSKKPVCCGDSHLLSKTELVRNVYENGSVRLESLKDELCRFRLIGPKSHQVVVKALRLAEVNSKHLTDAMNTGQLSGEVKNRWWDDYVVSECGSAEAAQQAFSWKKVAAVQNAAELPPFFVYGLTVRDPRLFLPKHRTSTSYSACGE